MKKLVTILSSISIISNSGFNVISCSTNEGKEDEEDNEEEFWWNKINVWWYLILINIYLLK